MIEYTTTFSQPTAAQSSPSSGRGSRTSCWRCPPPPRAPSRNRCTTASSPPPATRGLPPMVIQAITLSHYVGDVHEILYKLGELGSSRSSRSPLRELATPHATFISQPSELPLSMPRRCSAVPTTAARSFAPIPFRIFSPTSSTMACFHALRSSGLSGFQHSGKPAGAILRERCSGKCRRRRERTRWPGPTLAPSMPISTPQEPRV